MDRKMQRRRKVRHGEREREFGEVEENVNLRKAAGREKLFFSLSPTPSLPVPAVNKNS